MSSNHIGPRRPPSTIGQPHEDATPGEPSTLISVKLMQRLGCDVVGQLVEFTDHAVPVSGSLHEPRVAAKIVEDSAH